MRWLLIKRKKKAVGTLVFLLMILPALFVGLFLTSDYGNIILAHREASDVAEVVINAAVSSYELDANGLPTGHIDRNLATINARGAFDYAVLTGAVESKYEPKLYPNLIFNVNNTEVTIKIDFAVTPMIVRAIGRIVTPDFKIPGSIVKKAKICNSSLGETCASPL